jgi:hypothetical protein
MISPSGKLSRRKRGSLIFIGVLLFAGMCLPCKSFSQIDTVRKNNVVLTPDTAFLVIQDLIELSACRQMVDRLQDNITQLKNINNEKQTQLTSEQKKTDNQRQIIENLKAESLQNSFDKKQLQRQIRSGKIERWILRGGVLILLIKILL